MSSRVNPLDAMRSSRSGRYYDLATDATQTAPTAPTPAPASATSPPAVPRVHSPTSSGNSGSGGSRVLDTRYPVKLGIVTTVFWIGEKPSRGNKTPNHKSSWDTNWVKNYGGYDDPNPANRTDYHPKKFIPKLNPFYVALPYNDRKSFSRRKSEASRVIPWFKKAHKHEGGSVCKGRWVAIRHRDKICFAQWEDCGPFVTDDWRYVFGGARPKNKGNKGAGLDVSPAVRDYLGMPGIARCDWRFVDIDQVVSGPWLKYGKHEAFVKAQESGTEKLREQREAWLRRQGGRG